MPGPAVIEISAPFPDAAKAKNVAEALNRWFRWIVEGSVPPVPPVFDPLGVRSAEWNWALEEDVDWTLGPHARASGADVRIAIHTADTHVRLSGLLRALGGTRVSLVYESADDPSA
jgi:hypothetical protein